MRKIAYERPDGLVHLLIPAEEMDVDDAKLLELMAGDIPHDATNICVVTDHPEERDNRHAWQIVDGRIVVAAPQFNPVIVPAVPPPLPEVITAPEATPAPEPEPHQDEPQQGNWQMSDLLARAEDEHAPLPPIQPAPPAEEPQSAPHAEPEPHAEEEPQFPPLPPLARELEPAAAWHEPDLVPPPPPPVFEPPAVVVTDDERRRQAIERICFAAAQAGDSQIRYEIALQARNGNLPAQEMLAEEASVYGIEVRSLADKIITARAIQEQRVMRAHARKAQALELLGNMAGPDIDKFADAAVKQITDETHASPT